MRLINWIYSVGISSKVVIEGNVFLKYNNKMFDRCGGCEVVIVTAVATDTKEVPDKINDITTKSRTTTVVNFSLFNRCSCIVTYLCFHTPKRKFISIMKLSYSISLV